MDITGKYIMEQEAWHKTICQKIEYDATASSMRSHLIIRTPMTHITKWSAEAWIFPENYRKTSNISRTLDNKIVDNSDVVGASPVGAAPTTSSFST